MELEAFIVMVDQGWRRVQLPLPEDEIREGAVLVTAEAGFLVDPQGCLAEAISFGPDALDPRVVVRVDPRFRTDADDDLLRELSVSQIVEFIPIDERVWDQVQDELAEPIPDDPLPLDDPVSRRNLFAWRAGSYSNLPKAMDGLESRLFRRLHNNHCEHREENHPCQGRVLIDRNGVTMDCPICGTARKTHPKETT